VSSQRLVSLLVVVTVMLVDIGGPSTMSLSDLTSDSDQKFLLCHHVSGFKITVCFIQRQSVHELFGSVRKVA
jgi:hypothetical protein